VLLIAVVAAAALTGRLDSERREEEGGFRSVRCSLSTARV